MGKSKYAPALFEVLNKETGEEKQELKVPSWFERRRAAAAAAKKSAKVDPKASPAAEPAAPDRVEPDVTIHARAGRAAASGPIFAYDRVRSRVSASLVGAGIAGLALVVVAAGMYGLGSRFGEKRGRAAYLADTMDAIDKARQSAPDPDLLGPLRDESAAPGPAVNHGSSGAGTSPQRPAIEKTAWVKGNTYVIVQEFKPDSGNDAWIAREFFAESGILTAVATRSNGHHWLVTAEGFNYKEPAQKQMGKVLAQRVREVGKAYREAGGRDRCEGYEATLKDDSW